MRLVFMRHAPYYKFGDNYGHITEQGAELTQGMAQRLRDEHDIHPDIIVTTPEPRGVESADIAAAVFQDDLKHGGPHVVRELDEKCTEGQFLGELKKLPPSSTVFCVSHNTAIAGNVIELAPRGQKLEAMAVYDIAPSDAVIVDLPAASNADVVAEDQAMRFEIVHAM